MAQDHKKLLGTPFDTASRTMFTHVLAELVGSLKDDELSLAQVAAIHQLQLHGTMRVLEMAQRLSLSPSAASRMIDHLAGRELVLREEDPTDRRARVLSLTKKGQELGARMNEDRLKVFARHLPYIPQGVALKLVNRFLKSRTK